MVLQLLLILLSMLKRCSVLLLVKSWFEQVYCVKFHDSNCDGSCSTTIGKPKNQIYQTFSAIIRKLNDKIQYEIRTNSVSRCAAPTTDKSCFFDSLSKFKWNKQRLKRKSRVCIWKSNFRSWWIIFYLLARVKMQNVDFVGQHKKLHPHIVLDRVRIGPWIND